MDAGRSGEEHLRDWAGLHRTEPPKGFVAWWLRGAAAVARPLARAGVSPNALTVASMLAAVAAVGIALAPEPAGPALACVAVVASGVLDLLDGAVAVQAGRATRVGFLLDSALDRLSDAAFAAALVIVAGEGEWVAVAAVAAAWWLEYIRARAGLAEWGPDRGPPAVERQVITPGERPTRIILTAVGLGLPPLALAALWGQVVIVGGSALFLLLHSLARLHRRDAAPPAPTG
ncbi:MAG TPA: CDP-alcohol phosphatidyltransferase family protein [Acidimicrobiales bacterium]|nr:CDP-alcohol phosphatidyltransferase family protein [Acidimicrobiales bacterium]